MAKKTDMQRRHAKLSPAKQALLEKRLSGISTPHSKSLAIPRRPDPDLLPLSFSQERLWFLDQFEPGNPVYNRPMALGLAGPLNTTTLKDVLAEILRRHEVLRATFSSVGGRPIQAINPVRPIDLPVVDLGGLSPTEREFQIGQLAAEEAQKPFDLAQPPLLRGTLLRLDREDHVLLLVMHHIIFDGWSARVFIKEITTLYDAFSAGKSTPLPELPVQYADFAHWQRQWLRGDVLEKQLAYWRKQLAGAPPSLNLPTDHPRPAFQTHRGAQQSLLLPSSLLQSLKILSRQEGVTLFMTLLATFKILLYRYTGQDDIVVGSPVAGRTHVETEKLIGCLINTLVLRTDVSGDPTFRKLLRRIREMALAAYTHQDLPFEKLVEELKPERDPSRTPLFQVMFNLENVPAQAVKVQGLRISEFEFDSKIAPFDLTLEIVEKDEELFCLFVYNTDLFDAATIERMTGHFQTLLESIVSNLDSPISQLPLLTRAEEHQLLVAWNDTCAVYPQDQCIHHLFEAQVERTPEAIAVVFENQRLTYHQLNVRANQLAHYLRKREVGPEVLVGLCVERSLEMAVGLLGILKAGGAYLPLDPAYPQERLAFMMADAQAPIILTQQRLAESLPEHKAQVVCLDSDWESIAQESESNAISEVSSENLVYVIYTSGSTGVPKGVLISHRALVNLSVSIAKCYDLRSNDRILQFAALSFDVVAEELYPSWLAGSAVVLRSDQVLASFADFHQFVEQEKLTVLNLPTSYWHEWVSELSDLKAQLPATVRLVIVGGEKALLGKLTTWQEMIGDRVRWLNVYGPTEATVATTVYQPDTIQENQISCASVPIGRPLANLQLYILDQYLNPLPIGVPGELHIGGDGLARGYLNRPQLTDEKFIRNPFSDEPEARLYKTGDLARYLPDGNIEFLGRVDHQVKIRGFRIELGEIEAELGQHPVVKETVVIAREDVPGDTRLVAYVISAEQQTTPTVKELRSFLKEKLPDYMMPFAFVTLETFPRTPNGKIDRRALPAPDQTRPELEEIFLAPRTDIEEKIAKIWSDIFRLERVGIHDNFFELGGHSLLAAQVISRLRDAFQMELPLRRLFEAPTVAGLAEDIETASRTKQYLQTLPLKRTSRDEALPLSFGQQRLWFLDQLDPGTPIYNTPSAFRLLGSLDVTALEQSFNELVQRHEILRTTFSVIEGQPLQIIAPTLTLNLPVVDLRGVLKSEREIKVQRLITEEVQRPFDLTQGPLLRTVLFRLGEEEYILLLTEHHIITDHWSIDILFRELSTLYEAFSTGKPSPLPELPIQYADFAVWQRQWLQGEFLETQVSYWKKQLAGAPDVLEFPTDHPRPPVQTFRGAVQSVALPQALSEALKAMSQQEGVTLFMVLLAAFKLLLYRYTGQNNIVIGTPVAGRDRSEIEGLIGFFLNTLVLHTDLSGNPNFRELLVRVREVTLGAYAHQDLPFEKLLEELQPKRDLNRTPLFQVFFNMYNFEEAQLRLPGLMVEHIKPIESNALFDLTLYVREINKDTHLKLLYNADLFHQNRMAEMLEQFKQLLSQIVENPDERIESFSLVTPAVRTLLPAPTQVLNSDWKGAVHNQFSQQARQLPKHLAVIDSQDTWTYQELETRSNQLAHYLRTNGVQNQDIIAIYGHRSASLVWALLGVLKAGAAFMILDPAHPTSRLIDYLDAAQPRGWIQLEAADQLADELESFVATFPCCFRLMLPAHSTAKTGEFLKNYSTQEAGVLVGPDDLAYIAFTSGSSGRPKGILGRHGPLSHFLPWQAENLTLSRFDRFSMLSGLSHDPLQRDIFTALWVGATICIPNPDIIGAPGLLANWMSREKITFTHLTPAMGQILTETASLDCLLPSLRVAFFVGDKLTRRDVARLRHLAPNVTCINSYGSTETQRAVGYHIISPEQEPERDQAKAVYHLGGGIPDVQLLVLNVAQRLAGVGELGEIYVRSPHLARGYLNDETLTETRFITNPFTEMVEDKLYRTGDLGRYLPDGHVEFAGRADRQVKIRGFRIEPAEIEEILVKLPAVREAVVMVRDDVPGGWGLAAYLVGDRETMPSIDRLRTFLKKHLPDYMIPVTFVILDTLPLTPNGKIDYRNLPEPDQTNLELESAFVAPRDVVEHQLVTIWEDVLEIQPIGIWDNFFELGGHSLLAILVFTQIEQTFAKKLPLAILFQFPTVAQLADIIRQEGGAADWSTLVIIQPGNARPPFFCVHGFGGGVVGYAELARLLGPDQPFYGLQAHGLDGVEEPDTQIEAMAARYIQAMRRVQPTGPYNLGGYCFGGVVAFEMACQLQTQGERVGLVAIFEGYAPLRGSMRDSVWRNPRLALNFVRNMPYWLLDYLQLGYKQMWLRIRRKSRVIWKRFIFKLDVGIEFNFEDVLDDAAHIPLDHRRLMDTHIKAMGRYAPSSFPGSVTLFRVRGQSLSRLSDFKMGWGKLAASGVEVKMIAGAHHNILEQPHVQALAQQLKLSLDNHK